MGSTTMEAIKKMMQAMKLEKENAYDKADQLDQKLTEQKVIYEKKEEEINGLQKRISQLMGHVKLAKTQLQETTDKLDNVNKQLINSDGEVQVLTKSVRMLEGDFEQTEHRLEAATERLEEATQSADDIERVCKVLESRNATDMERIVQLEKELDSTVLLGEETDRKYEETAQLLAITDVDLERGEARLEAAESKVVELEEELKIVGNNLKSLVICEQEALQREVAYEQQIRQLIEKLTAAESRNEFSERVIVKLQKEVDRLEEAIFVERDKCKAVNVDIDLVFAELAGY